MESGGLRKRMHRRCAGHDGGLELLVCVPVGRQGRHHVHDGRLGEADAGLALGLGLRAVMRRCSKQPRTLGWSSCDCADAAEPRPSSIGAKAGRVSSVEGGGVGVLTAALAAVPYARMGEASAFRGDSAIPVNDRNDTSLRSSLNSNRSFSAGIFDFRPTQRRRRPVRAWY